MELRSGGDGVTQLGNSYHVPVIPHRLSQPHGAGASAMSTSGTYNQNQRNELDDPKSTFDVLFRYYSLLKTDLLAQSGGFKNHVRNAQIVLTVLLTGLTLVIKQTDLALSNDNKFVWLFVMFFVTTLIYYLVFDVLESAFAMRALEECLSILERRMNWLLGRETLNWQSRVANLLWPATIKTLKRISPLRYLKWYEIFLALVPAMLLPGYVYYIVWSQYSQDSLLVKSIVAILIMYTLVSAMLTMYVSREIDIRVRKTVNELISKIQKAESA